MKDLKELRVEISNRVIEGRRLESECEKYWDQTREMQKDYWMKENNIYIGDDVDVIGFGGVVTSGRLTGLDIKYSEPNPIVHKFKKDGSLSVQRVYIYSNSVISKAAPIPEK